MTVIRVFEKHKSFLIKRKSTDTDGNEYMIREYDGDNKQNQEQE